MERRLRREQQEEQRQLERQQRRRAEDHLELIYTREVKNPTLGWRDARVQLQDCEEFLAVEKRGILQPRDMEEGFRRYVKKLQESLEKDLRSLCEGSLRELGFEATWDEASL